MSSNGDGLRLARLIDPTTGHGYISDDGTRAIVEYLAAWACYEVEDETGSHVGATDFDSAAEWLETGQFPSSAKIIRR